ncbi:hypothetical protein PALB_34260 [Pseudoalteromonas luteoviolacea B = ATCC 29581]|nr:hypothetical protein PALB_34260 [Pseudoalteromonas luteoviolacea B = ATCC 29581]
MPIVAFILVIILIKLSILGLGILSIVVAGLSLLLIKTPLVPIPKTAVKRFRFKFKLVLWTHVSAYTLLVLKLTLIDGWHDIPAFIASHLVTHHLLSALIAGTLTWLAIKTYTQST